MPAIHDTQPIPAIIARTRRPIESDDDHPDFAAVEAAPFGPVTIHQQRSSHGGFARYLTKLRKSLLR